MISKKFLYSEQLLQLVLALSLLQVDPINYLEWGVSRTVRNGGIGPWQLEVAHTPFSDYPYMNRKTYVPLIEDLARFDRMHRSHDVQAYLLNVPDEAPAFLAANLSNNNSSTIVVVPTGNNTSSSTAENNERNTFITAANDLSAASTEALVNLIQDNFQDHGNVDDVFLQSDLFGADSDSIVDQNLADLHDYDEQQQQQQQPHTLPHFLAVPTKNELPDVWSDFAGMRENASAAQPPPPSSGSHQRRLELNLNGTRTPPSFTRTAIIDWNDYIAFLNDSSLVDVKKERAEEEEDSSSSDNEKRLVEDGSGGVVVVKKEETDDDVDIDNNNDTTRETEDNSNNSTTMSVDVTTSTELTIEVRREPYNTQHYTVCAT